MKTAEDIQATALLRHTNAIHLKLMDGNKRSIYELESVLGISRNDIARAIHSLKENGYIQIVGTDIHRYYHITDKGRLYCPPPLTPDFTGEDCDPRKKKASSKSKSKICGHRHFTGIPGKYPVDANGAILLNPDTILWKIYDAIGNGKASAEEVEARLEDVSLNSIWQANTRLLKMGLINYNKGERPRLYTRGPEVARSMADPDPIFIEHRPATPISQDVTESVCPPARPPEPVSTFPLPAAPSPQKVNDAALEASLDALLDKHSLSDVMLALFVRLDTEFQELLAFRRDLSQLTLKKG